MFPGGRSNPKDPNFSSVKLLLHCDGTNGSTTFTDNSGSPHTMTAHNGAVITTSTKKFGSGAQDNTTATAWIGTPDSSDWDFGSGDFTVEAWVYPTSYVGQAVIIGQNLGSSGWFIGTSNDTNGYIRFNIVDGAGAVGVSTLSPISLNQWSHVALVRSGSSYYLYNNGTRVNTSVATGSLVDSSDALGVGSAGQVAGSFNLLGYIDDVRITKGVARYTGSTYTPPARAFPNS